MNPGIFEALRVAEEYGLNTEEKMSVMRSNDISMNEEDISKIYVAIAATVVMGVIKKMREKNE